MVQGCDNEAFREWDELLHNRGLNFFFVERDEFAAALAASGFDEISIDDRSAAMANLARG